MTDPKLPPLTVNLGKLHRTGCTRCEELERLLKTGAVLAEVIAEARGEDASVGTWLALGDWIQRARKATE